MWFDEAVIYQIYPLGLCGAPLVNNGECEEEAGNHRILRILDWIDHIKSMGTSCVLFNPLFESDAHGYDTRNYNKVDRRLGTNEDFKKVCDAIHASGMKVMLDGVFNHAGRGFFAFEDVRQKKWDSRYKDWFHISFDGNTNYNDGFWYESWEGCNELVKLNLSNPEVKEYLFDAVKNWVNEYDIDGLRLDVAYCLDRQFLSELRHFTDGLKNEFVLMGETLHGDYNQWVNDNACYSVTNYECYKGIYSSFNSSNMHEIAYSLNRQFGNEQWCIYRGKHLFSFVDNHDVTRIASILENKNNLFPVYGLLFGMPGVPGVYYGSEWGITGEKCNGDNTLRPAIEKPEHNELTDWITALANAKQKSKALCYGGYRNLLTMPKQLIFERECDTERVIVAVNSDSNVYHADFDARSGKAVDLITGKEHDFGGGSDLQPYSCVFWKTER
ncbi:MAG: alpha-amylase family glycosyl hydrolase [Lachnospira sp.]|uniref:alpha-amylase family glycosyl hydrolase n=1 Tax=Lachnospira sp. TaxID=2049031 RepID=UPI003A4B6F69